jgi:very-long-chain (3R)-3-hydroxyacyl-CoA dehydratase
MATESGNMSTNTMSARKVYLTAYNILFASLWSSVFINAISNAQHGRHALFNFTEAQARWIQTASLIEVVHSAIGSRIQVLKLHHI